MYSSADLTGIERKGQLYAGNKYQTCSVDEATSLPGSTDRLHWMEQTQLIPIVVELVKVQFGYMHLIWDETCYHRAACGYISQFPGEKRL